MIGRGSFGLHGLQLAPVSRSLCQLDYSDVMNYIVNSFLNTVMFAITLTVIVVVVLVPLVL